MIGHWTLATLAQALRLEPSHLDQDLPITGISTDTRKVAAGNVFVCLRGERFDAHTFVDQAHAQGAIALVVDHPVASDLPQFCVPDTLRALGEIAAFNRQRFHGPLVAVTGSSGKTTVKEMLARLFSLRGQTLATQGNLNNAIGAPLTLLRLSDEDTHAVIELGASARGEIAYTTAFTQPDVAILNNAYAAHLEGFGSLDGVAQAKSEIYSTLSPEGWGLVNLDDPYAPFWMEVVRQQGAKLFTFAVQAPAADLRVEFLEEDAEGRLLCALHYHGQRVESCLPLLGRHNLSNLAAAAAAWVATGYPLQDLEEGIRACQPVKGRMFPLRTPQQTRLIDDSYNANPEAMKAAMDYLAACSGRRILVLGDMAELGEGVEAHHRAMGVYAAEKSIDLLMTTGQWMQVASEAAQALGMRAEHYPDILDLIQALKPLAKAEVTCLVKGSRSAGMERVVDALMKEEAPACSCC